MFCGLATPSTKTGQELVKSVLTSSTWSTKQREPYQARFQVDGDEARKEGLVDNHLYNTPPINDLLLFAFHLISSSPLIHCARNCLFEFVSAIVCRPGPSQTACILDLARTLYTS